jgi:hypothetical protein
MFFKLFRVFSRAYSMFFKLFRYFFPQKLNVFQKFTLFFFRANSRFFIVFDFFSGISVQPEDDAPRHRLRRRKKVNEINSSAAFR